MLVRVIVLEKRKHATDMDWEGLIIGATVSLSRAPNGWAQIDLPDGESFGFSE